MTDHQEVSALSLPVTGSDTAPYIYIDGFSGVATGKGVIRFRLIRTRMTDSGDAENEAVAHLAMSVQALVSIYNSMTVTIKDLRESGVIPPDVEIASVSPSGS